MPTALTPVETRLLTPFNTPGLETVRLRVLAAICGASDIERRIRAVTLTSQRNDFGPVFADVMTLPHDVLTDSITKPRSLFLVHSELTVLRKEWPVALSELAALRLSQAYLDLIDARLKSDSPQQVVTAACAVVIFGAILVTG